MIIESGDVGYYLACIKQFIFIIATVEYGKNSLINFHLLSTS